MHSAQSQPFSIILFGFKAFLNQMAFARLNPEPNSISAYNEALVPHTNPLACRRSTCLRTTVATCALSIQKPLIMPTNLGLGFLVQVDSTTHDGSKDGRSLSSAPSGRFFRGLLQLVVSLLQIDLGFSTSRLV